MGMILLLVDMSEGREGIQVVESQKSKSDSDNLSSMVCECVRQLLDLSHTPRIRHCVWGICFLECLFACLLPISFIRAQTL